MIIKGLILGFSVAAPIGPIGILCINRCLRNGFWSGLSTGMGAASADVIYALIAGLGISAVSEFLLSEKLMIQVAGLAFLLYLGLKIFFEKPGRKASTPESKNLLADYATSLGLTITNPMTILFFIAIFSGLGFVNSGANYTNVLMLVIGVFLGSFAWWLFLSGITVVFSEKVKDSMGIVNKVCGAIIFIFGLAILVNLLLT